MEEIKKTFKEGKMKYLKLMIAMTLMLILTHGYACSAFALELPEFSIDGYLLYNTVSEETTAAPGVSASVFTAFDKIIEGNIGEAFPSQNESDSRDYVAGPIIDLNLVEVLNRLKGVEITNEKLRLSVGIGALIDVFHFNGSDPMNCVYPAAHLRFIF
jgi:hypothetical protein